MSRGSSAAFQTSNVLNGVEPEMQHISASAPKTEGLREHLNGWWG